MADPMKRAISERSKKDILSEWSEGVAKLLDVTNRYVPVLSQAR